MMVRSLIASGRLLLGLAAFALTASAATREEALAARAAGDYPRAIELFATLLTAAPDDAELHLLLGTVQGWAGRYDDALATLARGLALAPEDTDLQLARGRVLAWSGRLGEAENVFRAILARQPENLEAQNMVGRVLTWRKRYDAAEAVYTNILTVAPSDPDALVGRGDVARFQERYDEARGFYQRALAVDPGSAELARRLAAMRGAGRWRFDGGYEHSFFAGDLRADWSTWHAALRYAADRRTGLALGLEHSRRFGLTDTQITGTVDRRFSDAATGYARLSATPSADFYAEHMLAVGGTWRVRGGEGEHLPLLLLADYRAATYAPGTAHSLWLGVTQYVSGRTALTFKGLVTRNLNRRWTDGWQIRLDREPADHWRWHLAYVDSNESLSSTVIDFTRELRTRAVFGGIYYEFSPVFGVRLDLTHEWAGGLPDRNAVNASLTTRF
ncbi:MAG: tetratricopeptide repeat protein [Opitutaceae bacterium]|nr:tetratricopeptide repeat protein [Opitutaceae bacterium]